MWLDGSDGNEMLIFVVGLSILRLPRTEDRNIYVT
jgi:hypothetical protein